MIKEEKNEQVGGHSSQLIKDGVDLKQLIDEGMIAAMDVVGEKFANSEIFVPEMLVSAVTMQKGLDLIKPLLKGEETEPRGTIVMCTVKGDIHSRSCILWCGCSLRYRIIIIYPQISSAC